MINKKTTILALACLLMTTSCADVQKRSLDNISKNVNKADNNLSGYRNAAVNGKDLSSVKFSDKIWLGSRGYRQQNGQPLPNKYDKITYMSSEPQTLNEIVSELSDMTGMRFVVRLNEGTSSEDVSGDSAMDLGLGSEEGSTSIDSFADMSKKSTVTYSGDFVGLLNQLSTRFDVFWEHADNVVYLSKYITRTLALYSLPSTINVKTEITAETDSTESSGGSDDSGGGEGSSTTETENTVKLETDLKVWEEMEAVIESMIPEGSTYALSPSTGTLTITSSPLAIRKVENLVKKQNEILSRQVVIDVSVMTITTSESDDFRMDFNTTLSNMSDKFGMGWSGPSGSLTSVADAGSFSSSFLSNSGGNSVDLVLDALSQKYDESVVTNSTVTTLNNHIVPLQIITTEAYLKEMEVTVDDGTTTTEATPGNMVTGFTMNVLPRILSDGGIMMQYSMSLSNKISLEKVEFGSDSAKSYIQLPKVVSRDFLQNAKLKSGNTLILAGYDRVLDASEKAGTGHPDNYFLGGGKSGNKEKEVIVIAVTPRIIE